MRTFFFSFLIGGTRSPILWILLLTISRAAFFPFPAKELIVSHPVSVCSPGNARHTSTASCSQTWVTLMTRDRLLVPQRRKMSALMYSRKKHANTSTSVDGPHQRHARHAETFGLVAAEFKHNTGGNATLSVNNYLRATLPRSPPHICKEFHEVGLYQTIGKELFPLSRTKLLWTSNLDS